jgi:glycosyltransferase involved in cell wall biosynthesis
MTKRLKLAFVVQRYGLEVNGGAEFHCRLLAEHLSKYHDVEIITTCARDYVTWKNEYNEGKNMVNNMIVWRFPVEFPRKGFIDAQFGKLSERIFGHYHSIADEINWIELQGPYSTRLLNFIRDKKDEYDYFIFFTYLYFPTVYGLHLVKDKAILVPTAHDEPPIYLSIFESVFKIPKAIAYNTEEEKKFINSKFENDDIISDIIGVGLQKIENINDKDFKKKYNVDKFIVYVGRIDESKGCKELIEYFIRFKEDTKLNIKLVLVGKSVMKVPKHSDIITPGFISEQDKYSAIGASELLVSPSKYESLSMVIMEAWTCNKAVLVNGNCDVLKGQCIKSNGGLYYENYDGFREGLNILLNDKKLRDKMGENGRKYVDDNYSWGIIESKYLRLFERLNI